MSFSPETLRRLLVGLPRPSGYCVAFSGGGDSTALLHAMHAQRGSLEAPFRAIHVVHCLHSDAETWADHCRRVCRDLAIRLDVRHVTVRRDGETGLEDAAREARYAAFRESLEASEMLLVAHTREDQAETVLFRLLRGAGVDGLGGMRSLRAFGPGWLARPLLTESRTALREWLSARGQAWLDDPDNTNTERSRAFLRHRVFPVLREHWPSADVSIARAGANLEDAADDLAAHVERDLARCLTPAGEGLALDAWNVLPGSRRRALLRHWLNGLGLPLPSRIQLIELERQALSAATDAAPCVSWPGAEAHRYRGVLYAFVPRRDPDNVVRVNWRVQKPLDLPAGLGRLWLRVGNGEAPDWTLRVGFRRGGEVIQLPGRSHHTDLKQLFQDWGVPPWERGRIPLVFDGDRLASVADLQPSASFDRRLGAAGARLEWRPGLA